MSSWVTILLALAPYLVPPLVGAITVLVKSAFEKMPANQQALAKSVVQSVVLGLEQNPGILPYNGPAKKQIAIEAASAILNKYGIKADPVLLNSLIEETVFAINSAKSPAPTPPVTAISAG